MSKIPTWELKGHSHQIADTGDYDGCYEITDGKISILSQDDDEEALQPIIEALNNSGCKFYQDDFLEFENKILKEQLNELQSALIHEKEMRSKEADQYNKRIQDLETRIRQLESIQETYWR